MLTKRVLLIGCLAVAGAGLIGGSVLLVGLARRIGPVDSQVPANSAPILVLLEHPVDGASYPSDSQIGVQVRAVTNQPIASLQLWADGQLVETENPTGGTLTQFTQQWVWTPGAQGDHTLVARALDQQGAISTSNVVTLHIGDPATADLFVQAQEGDTLAGLAQANGISITDAQSENPGVDPNASLPGGQPIYLPIGSPNGPAQPTPTQAPSAPPPTGGGSQPGPNPIIFWARSHLTAPGEPSSPPAAPAVTLSLQACDVSLSISDGAKDAVGLFVYRADTGGKNFTRVATLGPSPSQTFSDPGLEGPADYYVAAFNSAGESPSDIVHAQIPADQCAPSQPNGITLRTGTLHLPQPIPIAYVYLSADGGQWFRVPSDPQAFMRPNRDGGYSVGGYLPGGVDPGGWKTLSGHVWGWQGGQLIHVGDFDQQAAPTVRANVNGGLLTVPSKLEICNLSSCGGDLAAFGSDAETEQLGPWAFRWTPQDPSTTGGIFQVSDHPFVGDCSLDPSQLLMTGPVSGNPQPGIAQQFDIDLSSLDMPLSPQKPPPVAGGVTSQGLGGTPLANPGQGAASQNRLGIANLAGLLGETWTSPQASLHLMDQEGHQVSLPTYYFRVLPRINNQVVCQPTNAVQLVKKPGSPPLQFPSPPAPEYQVTNIDFSEPWISSITSFGCVKVLEDYPGLISYKKGQIVCPPVYKGGNKPWYEQMFSFVVDAINWVSKAYQDAQNALVNLVADVIPGCNSASWCKTALQAGLKAGLTALGLPPSLPNFDQLVELGKGSLTDAIASYATDATGVPCDNTEIPGTSTSCKGLIRKGIDAMVDEVKKAAANPTCGMSDEEAHSHGIDHGLCLPPGLKTQSVTSGLQPAQLKVTVKRIAADQKAGACDLELNFPAENQQAVGDSLSFPQFPGSFPITAPLHGDLFKAMYGDIPDIPVGQTTTIPFVLQANTSYLVPGYLNALGQLGPSLDDYWFNWGELYVGAQLTIKAGGQYPSNKYYSDPTCVEGDQIQVGPLERPQVHAP